MRYIIQKVNLVAITRMSFNFDESNPGCQYEKHAMQLRTLKSSEATVFSTPDIRKIAAKKVRMLRPLCLLIRVLLRRRGVYSIGGKMIFGATR
jgi:hypothetical protein